MNIRTLSHLTFLAFAVVVPSCGGGTSDTGAFFDWGILDVGAPDNAPFLTCEETGGDTVVLEAQDLTRGGAPQTFSYPCKANGGTVPGLPAGQYSMTIRLLRADRVAVSSLPLGTVTIARRGQTDLGVVAFEIQSFTLNWLIKQAANPNAPVTCAAVGATQVELTATAATQAPQVFSFPCIDGQGQTQAVTVGAYAISTRLKNAAGTVLSEQTLDFVTPNNTPAVLPLVTFTVN